MGRKKIDKVDGRINNGGKREGSGRKKGVPNKVSGDVKEMLLSALDTMGGADYFVQQAKENPVSFNALIARVIPKDVAVKIEDVTAIITTKNYGT